MFPTSHFNQALNKNKYNRQKEHFNSSFDSHFDTNDDP
jgi:hypothetical protein